jgi:hypothetical protein
MSTLAKPRPTKKHNCVKDKIEQVLKLAEEVKEEATEIKKVIRRQKKDATGNVN